MKIKTSSEVPLADGEDKAHCRICWGEEENDEDPLILACKCKGTVGLIHYQCLKNWIATQKQEKAIGDNVMSYFWKKFECEICK